MTTTQPQSSTRHNGGFTMIELLVAAAILALLTTISVVSFRSANIKARDGKRKADISQVRSALELYRSSTGNGQYPSGNFSTMVSTLSSGEYLSDPLPADPTNTGTYVYVYTQTSTTSYCLCANLENGGGNRSSSTCTGSSGTYYCLNNP